ncbi:uncharacterized protein LOC120935696 [Rana temporaria]|uniref:uncharacterized protein LOC120935696 n=1 Tax=Rana temporaria TaxID=8407 RepID=UPI001AAD990D|nr:uncharacterized protein LOC120935696 [Rana temporaria]
MSNRAAIMSDKPVLYYFDGRGKMESIRWALAAVGVEFEEKLFDTKEEYEKLLKSGDLLFQQVPMVEMDGLKLVQSKAILSYIAGKYNIYGKDLKERLFIDMYTEGATDLMGLVIPSFFMAEPEQNKQLDRVKQRALNRYFPVYEKALENQEYLVGKQFSIADVQLLEVILAVEELHPTILQNFPNLQAFKARISSVPTIEKFLSPGSKRKPIADATYVNTVTKILFSWPVTMCDKIVLHYFNGRGRAESIRWLLATAGVKFEEHFLDTKEQYDQLLKNGDLMFQQVPMLEIDGIKLISTKAIQNYIVRKYNLYGKDLKEKAFIDMYVDGISDLSTLMLSMPFQKEEEKQKQRDLIKQRALNRYFPVFEKALANKKYLVGDELSFADVGLVEAILAVEEVHPNILQDFSNLQAFKARMIAIPTIKKFLEPGSQKKPIADETYVNTVKKVLSL